MATYQSSHTGAEIDAAVDAVSGKADKATTLAGYGITNAYTKTDSDSRYYQISGATNLSASSSNPVDLNSVINTGNYSSTTSGASYVSNKPVSSNKAFRLIVGMTTQGDANYKRQRFQYYNEVSVYERYTSDGGTNWSSWEKVQDDLSDYLPLAGGTLTGALTVSADVTTTGDVYMDNAKAIYVKDTNNTNRELIKLSSSDNIIIGAGTIAAGGDAYIYGNSMRFRIGGTGSDDYNALILDSSKNAAFMGYIKATGDIYMSPAISTTNTDSKKIYFRTSHIADTTNNVGPYVQAITHSSSYGRKRLSVFQVDAASYTGTYSEVFTILPNGNVGIGTVSPTTKLGVSGDVDITGSLSFNGTAVATVYSGSSAPSSGTGSDGDIYIQTS